MPQDPQPPNRPPEDTSLLTWLGFRDPFEFGAACPLGSLLGSLLTLVVPLLFLGALFAAGAVLWHSIHLALSGSKEGLNLGAGALIAALLGAPFVIWGTVLKHQSLRYQKEGHITDRISKAVEQLGAEKTVKVPKEDGSGSTERTLPNIEVRIGAILSLERIAQDSTKHDKGRDHVRVMEILCAYIRENAPAKNAEPGPYDGMPNKEARQAKLTKSPNGWLRTLQPPREDVQVALTVLSRRTKKQHAVERSFKGAGDAPYRLDLSKTNLRRANLSYGDFRFALFFQARLEGAYLHDANLSDCNFDDAILTGVKASRATFDGSRLVLTDFSYSICINATFRLSHLRDTDFVGTVLAFAIIDFTHSQDTGVFHLVNFSKANLTGGFISGKFPDEEYTRVTMDSLRFRKANLGYAWSAKSLPLTFGDASVTLADEADRPAHWPRWVLPDTGPNSYEAEYQRWLGDPQGYTPPPPPA